MEGGLRRGETSGREATLVGGLLSSLRPETSRAWVNAVLMRLTRGWTC